MIFGRRRRRTGRVGGFGGRRDQRRFMRDMQRGGCLTAIFNLFMFRIIRLVIGLVLIFIVLAICVVVALVAS